MYCDVVISNPEAGGRTVSCQSIDGGGPAFRDMYLIFLIFICIFNEVWTLNRVWTSNANKIFILFFFSLKHLY